MAIKQTGKSVRFDYTGEIEEFIIPTSGLYKLEVWGAQGGNGSSRYTTPGIGGCGGYSEGYVVLEKNTKLYICVGGQGAVDNHLGYAEGGYNGGGHGGDNIHNGNNMSGGGGGGATHIASMSGLLQNLSSHKDSIYIVAGGGGGGSGYYGDPYDEENPDTEYFTKSPDSWNGGAGGGLSGKAGGGGTYDSIDEGIPGTQTSPGNNGSFGAAGKHSSPYAGGGGGGWYGGGNGGQEAPGGGGSGYIGGVPIISYRGQIYSPSTTSGYNSGNGSAVITFIKKSSPYIYLGTEEISEIYFGDKKIIDIIIN